MIYFMCGDAGVRVSEPYDPQGDRQKAARYAAIQRNLWGNDNLPPRGRPRRSPGAVPREETSPAGAKVLQILTSVGGCSRLRKRSQFVCVSVNAHNFRGRMVLA